ncbi:MAG: 6-phosphogluconolactonase [Planctomycetota bacterium]
MKIHVRDDLPQAFLEVIRGDDLKSIALAGGSTPRKVYERWSKQRCPWESMHFFFGDERMVPPDDARSNFRMAREALLAQVPAKVHRIRGEDPPEAAASSYERELQQFFGADGRFDLVILGVGTDGHTASLFPGTSVLDSDRWAEAVWSESQSEHRVSLTFPVLNAARKTIVLAKGADKAEVITRWVNGRATDLPIGRLKGNIHLLLDETAASKL